MTVITFAASIIGPFVSFLDIDTICYITSMRVALLLLSSSWIHSLCNGFYDVAAKRQRDGKILLEPEG